MLPLFSGRRLFPAHAGRCSRAAPKGAARAHRTENECRQTFLREHPAPSEPTVQSPVGSRMPSYQCHPRAQTSRPARLTCRIGRAATMSVNPILYTYMCIYIYIYSLYIYIYIIVI